MPIKKLSRPEFFELFDYSIHTPILDAAARFHAEAVVVFENRQMDSSWFGERTAVMVGHLDVPDLTTDLPSSLTPAVYELLRGQYRFDGLVLTDDLGAMKAITDEFTLPTAVARALEAGADMALWTSGGGVAPVLDGLQQALNSGKLDGAANDKAVARILSAKGLCTR